MCRVYTLKILYHIFWQNIRPSKQLHPSHLSLINWQMAIEQQEQLQRFIFYLFISMKDDCRCANSYYRNKPKLKLESETTHNANFKAHHIEKAPDVQPPKVVQKRYDPELLQSSYKTTFTKPNVSANTSGNDQALISQYYQNKPKNVPFSSETEYNKSFQKTNVKPEPQPAYVYKPKPTKFEGQSSYKSQFVQKSNNDLKSQAQEANVIKEYIAKKPKVAFEGSTSYKQTFKDHAVKAQKQPQYRYEPKKTKFEGESSYKTAFKELPKQVYKSDFQYCPVHPSQVAIK